MNESFKGQITREDIQEAITALEQGEGHAFGPSTFYDVLEGDRRYPPKAVVGLAARRVLGRALRPDEFSGGEESWAFRLLRARGFNVVKKLRNSDTAGLPKTLAGQVWIEDANTAHDHGGPGWEFGSCLWSPSSAKGGVDYYSLMREPKAGDYVIHFSDSVIVGWSRVAEGFQERTDPPPNPAEWAGRSSYYRIALRDYQDFPHKVPLSEFIVRHGEMLAEELRTDAPKRFPFIIYSGAIRRAQGAYLTRCTQKLYDLILNEVYMEDEPENFDPISHTWRNHAHVQERIRGKLALNIPNHVRRAALDLLGCAIEAADEARSDAWYLRETEHGLRLIAGWLNVCELRRARLRVSVVGPVTDDILGAVGAEVEEELKWIPGGMVVGLPMLEAAAALPLLKDGMDAFIESAMSRTRRSLSLENHVPEAISYLSTVLGRDLPQPEPGSELPPPDDDADAEGEDAGSSREPKVRGRAPIFEYGQRSINSLISDIEIGAIALPDLQRPFVWEDTKVRDLLDSLFVGFPVGTLVFWHTTDDKETRGLGTKRPGLRATTLVIDGQQRLTSLYAVLKGEEVVGKDGETRKITIAFRPRDGRFAVSDAAIRRDPEYLADVTEIWSWKGTRTKPQIRRELMNGLREKGRLIDDQYEDAVDRNIDRANSIADYRFPTVDIRKTAAGEIAEEDVAEIFVRINSQGARLGQADFVLTLLSVYHGELREKLEDRARAMSVGAVVGLDTQQLLRAVCGVAFGRARMSAVYRFLRGVNPDTEEADSERRINRLNELDTAANDCVELTPWRDYLLRVKRSGFVSEGLVASKNAIVNAYAFYIRGRKAAVSKPRLDAVISRWVFASLLTARYSGASETAFEEDLARLGRLDKSDPDAFVRELDVAMAETLTGDYWTQTLVSALETQRARAPAALAFRAAQVVLGARALFSDQLLQNLLDHPQSAGRTAREAHHLFPTNWLRSHGIEDRRRVNQVANLADVGWHENTIIGGQNPSTYIRRLRDQLDIDDNRWGRMCAEHALPPGWEHMGYNEFIRQRRTRMAALIHVAFRQLGGEEGAVPLTPPWFLPGAEMVWHRIADAERALRSVVREAYASRFGDAAAIAIQTKLPEREREALTRTLRSRPPGSDPLTVVDYLYLGQLPALAFADDVWQEVRSRLRNEADIKQRIQIAVGQIAPVRNEIAHVREVASDRLLKATVACDDLAALLER